MEKFLLVIDYRADQSYWYFLRYNSILRMSALDWIVLFGTLIMIVSYGVYKTRGSKNIESYLKGDNSMKWWTIGLSIMATQASAITFLSTPGQAYESGMGFIQFLFWFAYCHDYSEYLGFTDLL